MFGFSVVGSSCYRSFSQAIDSVNGERRQWAAFSRVKTALEMAAWRRRCQRALLPPSSWSKYHNWLTDSRSSLTHSRATLNKFVGIRLRLEWQLRELDIRSVGEQLSCALSYELTAESWLGHVYVVQRTCPAIDVTDFPPVDLYAHCVHTVACPVLINWNHRF